MKSPALLPIFLIALCIGLLSVKRAECLETDTETAGSEAAESTGGSAKTEKALKKEKNAEIHFDRGVDFFRDGITSAALAEFLKSYKEVKHWAVLYNVGVCYYRMGRYDNALKTLNQYMDEGGDNIPPERRFAVEKLKIKMAASYGSIIIEYRYPGVRITIDGKHTYQTPIDDPIPVAAGIHTLYMFREGHYPVFIEVSVTSGEETVVPVKMDITPLMEAWLTDTERLEYLGERKRIKKLETAFLALLGLSAATGIATIAAGAVTCKLKEDQYSELFTCGLPTSREDCPKAYDLKDKREKWKWATNGLAVATGVMIAAMVTVWAVKKVKMNKLLEESLLEASLSSAVKLKLASPGLISITW